MIFIDLLATIFEDVLFCFVPMYVYKVFSWKRFLLTTLLCIITTFFFCYVYVNNNLLVVCLGIIIGISISLSRRKLDLSFFIFPWIIVLFIVISNTLALCLVSSITQISILDALIHNRNFIAVVVISRMIALLFSLPLLNLRKIDENLLPHRSLLSICIIFLMLGLMLNALINAIVNQNLTINVLYELIVCFIILAISSVWVYYVILKQNKENLRISKQLMSEERQKELYSIIKKTDASITRDKHMMKYSMMKIINYLSRGDTEEALGFAKKELDFYMRYKVVQVSNNPMLDFELTNFANQLKEKEINLQIITLLQGNSKVFQDMSVINYFIGVMKDLCRKYRAIDEIQFFLEEINDH